MQSLLSDKLLRPRVLVVGDVMVDEYLRGSVRRISPEAPVPVLDAASSELLLGGAANVAKNLAALGCDVTLGGVVGDDLMGGELVRLVEASGVRPLALVRDGTRRTTHKLRVVAQSQHIVRVDREDKAPLSTKLEDALIERVVAGLEHTDAVILSDYKKGVLGPRVLRAVIDAARARKVFVAVDPKGAAYERYKGCDVLTPNMSELEQATGIEIHGEAELLRAAQAVLAMTEAESVLCTCGKDGMVLVRRGAEPVRIAAEAREVYDVTGAGDTVIATLVFAKSTGLGLDEAARLANTAAGIVVGKLGTAAVTRSELLERVSSTQATTKLRTLTGLRDELGQQRARGRKVVFTNGCFDIIHPGHVEYLAAARRQGDLLVVGLNTDASVRRLKGPTRPVMNEDARVRVLSGLAAVDYIVLFDEPTPAETIAQVRPDVLVKGADYKPDQVVGRDLVESYGGRLVLVPLSAGQSTTNIVDVILERHGER